MSVINEVINPKDVQHMVTYDSVFLEKSEKHYILTFEYLEGLL